VKFLRRTPAVDSEAASSVLEELQLPFPPGNEAREPRAQAAEVLAKTAILQNRGKKIRLIQAAARLEAPWAPFFLVGLIADPIEEVRGIAVRGLIARDDCPIPDVCERLTRPPWFAKSAALQVLAAKRIPATARCIRTVIEDPNADVRRSAVFALGEIGGAESRTLLVRMGRDASPPVRAAAQAALDKICDFKFT